MVVAVPQFVLPGLWDHRLGRDWPFLRRGVIAMSSRKPRGRRTAGSEGAPADGRKTRQLCAQVARTVESVLVGELGDGVLRDLIVHSVEPAPDESRLMVTVGPYTPGIHLDPVSVLQHIHAAGGRIRAEVTAAITRRRAPALIYQYAEPRPPEPVADMSGR
jgi:hypothetical protein